MVNSLTEKTSYLHPPASQEANTTKVTTPSQYNQVAMKFPDFSETETFSNLFTLKPYHF